VELSLDVDKRPQAVIVTARGEIDLATTGHLRDTLSELVVEGYPHLVVDLNEVTFLDSTGLGTFIGARRRAHAFKGSFALVCENERLTKIFQITGLDKVFDFYATPEDAVTAAGRVREASAASAAE